MSGFHLRPAERRDAKSIVYLIRELALYEKYPEATKASEELILENIFDKGYARAVLAESTETNEAIGMALYFFNFSTWTGRPGVYLEDLFVLDTWRGKGIGKALFAFLGKVAREEKCARLDWQVLDWNEPSKQFYRSLGAKELPEWDSMRMEGEALERLGQSGSNERAS